MEESSNLNPEKDIFWNQSEKLNIVIINDEAID